MGFSLESFFRDLDEILNSKASIFAKFRALRKVIQEGRDYARECGHIQGGLSGA